jgi:superfamily I DNA/RNA helicase
MSSSSNAPVKSTPEQEAYMNFFLDPTEKRSGVVIAVAGSGKTTTILSPLDDKRLAGKTVAMIAFNKSIAGEIKEKLAKRGIPSNRVEAGTCHSFGLRAYSDGNGRPQVEGNKVFKITEDYFANHGELPFVMKPMVRKLVSMGKQNLAGIAFQFNDIAKWCDFIYHYDINTSDAIMDEEIAKVAIEVLRISNNQRKVIDFDDMIYLPILQNLKFQKYDYVVIDEAQDTNPARREMAKRMLDPETGRLMAVGDDKQAIYGFTGAGADSLEQIKRDFGATEMSLTYCFRSGKKIVEFAKQWNEKIQPAPNAIDGEVSNLEMEKFYAEELTAEKVMLCRNTKPLIEVAFTLIRKGIPAYVEGRDIGEGLKKLATRWKIKRIDQLIDKLEAFKARELKKARDKNDDSKVQFVEDQVATLMVIIDRCQNAKRHLIDDVVAEINILFRDTDEGQRPACFTLSTIHKSKGREWNTVYWLDRLGTLPSKYAKQAWQLQQESNLCYVAATRAKQKLIEVA